MILRLTLDDQELKTREMLKIEMSLVVDDRGRCLNWKVNCDHVRYGHWATKSFISK